MEIKYVSQSKNEHLALGRTIGFKLFICRQRKKMTQRSVWKKLVSALVLLTGLR